MPYWIYFIFLQNFFGAATPVQHFWLGPLWSLAVEEQFYLVAPLLVRKLSRSRLVKVLVAVGIFAFVLRIGTAGWTSIEGTMWGIRVSYSWTPARADQLALGVLLAVAWTTSETKQWLLRNVNRVYVLFYACAVLIMLLMFWLVKLPIVAATLGRPIYGIFYSALLIVSLADTKGQIAWVLRWRWLRELGRISYCVYMIHRAVDWLTFRFIYHSEPRFDSPAAIGITLLAFGSTLVLAQASWHFFENPLIRRGHEYKY
jgi:peptidoglycan/LPS O-acetylase OafA/YrhL